MTWLARLGKDGRTVRCGWTVGGRANCSSALGFVYVDDDGRHRVIFDSAYKLIGVAPTTLGFTSYSVEKMTRGHTRGNRPRPRRAVAKAPDWAPNPGAPIFLAHDSDEWTLPATVPCEHGHMNEITETVLAPREPSR